MALTSDQKSPRVLRFSNRKILVTVFVLLGFQMELLFAVHHHWRAGFTILPFGVGWLGPLYSYITVRRISETGFTWIWLLSVLVSFASTALLAYSFYYLVSHPPGTSLEPTGVGAGSSAAQFTSRVAGGSALGRLAT